MNKFFSASLISKIVWTPHEEEQIRTFIENIKNKPEEHLAFFDYCKKWKLASWTYTQLYRHGLLEHLTRETQTLFFELHAAIRNENEKRNKSALCFLTAFKENNIEVAILKGNLFAHSIYQDTGYKRMNDFDMLIHEKDWSKVQDIYFSLGYVPLGFGWSGEKQKTTRFSHVGMSFISPDFSCITGSQWGLKSPSAPYTVNIEDAWTTATEFDFLGLKVKQLSPEYNLLHLILHMGVYKCGIRDCMDVYNLLLRERINENKLLKIIHLSRAIDKAYFTFFLSNICSGGTMNGLLDKIKPGKNTFIIRRLAKRIKVQEESKDFQDSYNDYFQNVEKQVIYFNLFSEFHKKIVFYFLVLKLIFLPEKSIALKLSDKTRTRNTFDIIKARLMAPYFVFSLIAQEIGWTFTFLLFLKLFVDLLISWKNYFVKSESYFGYLKKRGVDPASIEKVVKNIQ